MPTPVAITFLLLVLAVIVVQVSVASYAYQRLGLAAPWAYAVLIASIVGSRFNIPVAHLRGGTTYEAVVVRVYGMWYVIPHTVRRGMRILAVNVGGAIVPAVLATYLFVRAGLGWSAVIAITIVSGIVHVFARIVPGVGIVVPTLVPPISAVLVAWAAETSAVAALAYVAGTLGTLIGADLLNLRRVRDLDAPVLSIGGGGTFDGIFVTGILAVLLAAV